MSQQPILQQLIDALRSDDLKMRKRAYTRLIQMGKPATKSLTTLIRDDNIEIQVLAKQALLEIGDGSIEALVNAMRDPYLGVAAATVLAKYNDAAIEPLVHAICFDDAIDPSAARTAVRFFGETMAPALLQVFAQHDEMAREHAYNYLASLGPTFALQAAHLAIHDNNRGMVLKAIGTLVSYNTDNAARDLGSVITHPDLSIATKAVVALGKLQSDTAFEVLISALQDERDFVRKLTARTLGQYGDPHAINYLRVTLDDPSPDVAIAASEAIQILIQNSE